MRYYPIFVNLKNKDCLVVGAGEVGKRKSQSLLEAGAKSVLILDTNAAVAGLKSILDMENVQFESREFKESDLDGKFLVMACTSNQQVNGWISQLCEDREILCNIADQPEKSSFIVPATFKRGDLTMAMSTAGKSPAMARRIRRELQEKFGDEYAQMLTLMGRIRPLLLELGMDTQDNTTVFRELVNSNLLQALGKHDLDAAREILEESLPQSLYVNIPELLDGLI